MASRKNPASTALLWLLMVMVVGPAVVGIATAFAHANSPQGRAEVAAGAAEEAADKKRPRPGSCSGDISLPPEVFKTTLRDCMVDGDGVEIVPAGMRRTPRYGTLVPKPS